MTEHEYCDYLKKKLDAMLPILLEMQRLDNDGTLPAYEQLVYESMYESYMKMHVAYCHHMTALINSDLDGLHATLIDII